MKFDKMDWFLFILATYLMTIVIMNILIAIINDKYEEIMSSIEPIQFKDLCAFLLELETFCI